MYKILVFIFSAHLVFSQNQFDVVIPTGQNNVAGLFSPAVEINNEIISFISNNYRNYYGFSETLLKLDKKGNFISNELFLDTINPYWVFDAAYDQKKILICGVQKLKTENKRIIMYGILDSNLDTIWTRTITSNNNHPGVYSIARLNNGNIAMVGSDTHIRPTGGAYSNLNNAIFILTDSIGNIIKYTHFEKPDTNKLETFNYIMQSSTGDIYCVGQIQVGTLHNKELIIKLNSQGGFVWRKEIEEFRHGYQPGFCKELKDGNILIVSSRFIPFYYDDSQTWTNVIVIDKSGKKIIEKSFFNVYGSNNNKCVQDIYGNIICTGAILHKDSNYLKGYLIKLNQNGDSIWKREFTRGWKDRDEIFLNIANATDGGYYLTGNNWVQGDNSSKAWIVKVDSNGCVVPGCNTAVNIEPQEYDNLFLLYPNPVSDKLTIFLNDQTYEGRSYTLHMYDINGREVMSKKIQGMRSKVDVSNLVSGMYVYRINYGTKVIQSGKVAKN